MSENQSPSTPTQSPVDEHGGWPGILGQLSAASDLSPAASKAALQTILTGTATDAQIAGFIMALRIKGETVDEMSGLVQAMREAATPLDIDDSAIDIVGVGGAPTRRKHALNVSTMASFVASGAGATVCKHGNRKASSTSGSFDLLEQLGIAIDVTPEVLAAGVNELGLGFAFARTFHPAMRFVGPVRAELGVPTVFNQLGPLAHPGLLTRQVVGVGDPKAAPRMIEVLRASGSVRSMVVTGDGNLDEFSTTGPSTVHELRDGEITSYQVSAADVGLAPASPDDLVGGDAVANAAITADIFSGTAGAKRDIVVLNAAAGLVVSGVTADLGEGVGLAQAAIDDGRAAAKVEQLKAHNVG